MRKIALLVVLTVLAACSQNAMLDTVAAPADRQIATKLIADLSAGKDEDVLKALFPQLREQMRPVLPKMRALLPSGRDSDVRLVDASWQTFAVLSGPTVRYRYLAYSVDRGPRHALVRIGLRSDGAAPVSDLYVDPLTASVDELTAFDLLGKSPAHYAFLLLAVAAFAISVIAIVLIWRTRGLRRRWLWTIGSLLSVGHFGLYWSNGAWNIAPLYIQLLGASAVKRGMLTSWEIAFGVPVIAILFLIRRRAILRSLNLPQSNESGSTVA